MKITRIYTGSDGQSHFEDVDIPLEQMKGSESRSRLMPATGIILSQTSKDFKIDWHNAPRRQFLVTLQGECEIVVGDGATRHFGPGDIMLAEDTTGQGHTTRGVGNRPSIYFIVTLD